MSMFQDARDVVINGGIFQNIQTENTIYHHSPTGINILHEASTPEAAVDAAERSYAPSCYPGTREQYIEDITKWAAAASGDDVQPIYWMKGPAGVGKSAIAQTCATRLKDTGQLGAAFFFSINGRRKDHSRFFPTLAYQLSTNLSADCRNYRDIIDRRISDDRTLVKKTMGSQFKSLIVEPLQELKKQGKELQKRTIFIDGLDECESQDAQVEIITIIVSSVRTGSTPFCWAIFSREESHIVSTFADPDISSRCCSVSLPISRKADKEIELYLRGGFKNILQRRNLFSQLSSWPTQEDIWKLVSAAAGLFAHSATVLRFIDRHSYSGFKESLEVVLISIAKRGTEPMSVHAELDRVYTLILQRVPADILSNMLLFLTSMAEVSFDDKGWLIASVCNAVGISEAVFRSIYHHLQAVLIVQDPPQFTIDRAVALEDCYIDQDSTFKLSCSFRGHFWEVHGSVNFHHRSFYDFITDPDRSSTFCVTTPAAREKLFHQYIQQQLRYASSYIIQGTGMVFPDCIDSHIHCAISELVPTPDVSNASSALAWPQGSEFVDSSIKLWSFLGISFFLSHDSPKFGRFLQDIPPSSLQKLGELDYRKYLIALAKYGPTFWKDVYVAGYIGTEKDTDDSVFSCIDKDNYDGFDPIAFLRIVKKLEESKVIRPYSPYLGSSRAASLVHAFSRQKSYGKSHGQYKMGHGDKSVIWYWKLDTEKRYFHEFQTMNFAKAMAYYKVQKSKIWDNPQRNHVTNNDGGKGTGSHKGDDVVIDEDNDIGDKKDVEVSGAVST